MTRGVPPYQIYSMARSVVSLAWPDSLRAGAYRLEIISAALRWPRETNLSYNLPDKNYSIDIRGL